jgi:uncharacterized protein (TIGR03382 family)
MLRTAIVASLLAAATPAAAATIANDFNSENGGLSALNYAGFADLVVTGAVDLVFTPDFGITCAGGTGGCVDLGGSPGPGAVSVTLPAPGGPGVYAVTFSFDLSGNQRLPGSVDGFYWGIIYGGGPFDTTPLEFIDWDAPFNSYGLVIDFVTAGGFWTAYVGTTNPGTAGPILDNFVFTVSDRTDIPTPAALALFGLGLGALAARRRTS